ncbi:GPI transamidase component [Lithohypha guttulata]|uniref:GPI transamidase component n=1 Tax=Lithohypha guttulata TaxID=1690604 RepID=UPI002DDEBFE0|nr:GPI transamidase component [Lithohypha guttulata]KAK5100361.1 GPI transamidase component [Lithohypha guttulata]
MSLAMGTPVETQREVSLRSRVVWSFWVIILLLGLPTWWATTSIERASLPSDLMLASHDDLWYSIPVCLSSASIAKNELAKLAWETQKLAKGQQFLFKFHVQAQNQCQQDAVTTLITIAEGEDYDIQYSSRSASFEARYPEGGMPSLPFHLATFLQSAFLEEHASVAYQLFTSGKSNEDIQSFIQTLPQDMTNNIQKAANRAFKPGSNYHLSISLFTAGSAPSSWDIRQALDTYIEPIVYALSSTSNISVASQVQLYSSFSPSVQPQQRDSTWRLKKEDLTSFVNTAEWPLSPSIGQGPTINFITYVPAKQFIPLLLDDNSTNSWLVPQWGGITILNPPLRSNEESELESEVLPDHLDHASLVPAFESFQTQLLQLLGVPQSTKLPLQERLKSFQRLSALSLYLRTSSNLGSLARLAQRLSNIPIPRHVLRSVDSALARLSVFQQCLTTSTTGESWSTCFTSARAAFVESEKAFFDKSMVGQVYFPDEHKVAVYLPLLGPVGVPLVVGLLGEMKSIIGRRKR